MKKKANKITGSPYDLNTVKKNRKKHVISTEKNKKSNYDLNKVKRTRIKEAEL